MFRLKNSKTTGLGRGRIALVASICALQMKRNDEQWQDIKPQLLRDADGWHIEGAPYYAEVKDDGSRLFVPDPDTPSKYLRLPAHPMWRSIKKEILSSPAKIDGQILPDTVVMRYPWGTISFIFSNTGMHFEILLNQPPPTPVLSDRITLDVESVNLGIDALLQSKTGLGIPTPRLIDNRQQERPLYWSHKAGQLELGYDLTGLEFPILLKNTTIDVAIANNADDDNVRRTAPYWSNSTVGLNVGMAGAGLGWGMGLRFTGIGIPAGSIIGVAYANLKSGGNSGGAMKSDLCFENSLNPGQIGDYGDHVGRARTTPIAWDGWAKYADAIWFNTPSIVAPLQQVVDDNGGTGNAVIFFFEDKDQESAGMQTVRARDWGVTNAAEIHIEYTGGGWTGKISGVTNPAKVMGVDVANINSVKGVT